MTTWNPKRYCHVFKTCMRKKTTSKHMSKLEENGHSKMYTYIHLNGSVDCRGCSAIYIYR